MPDVVAKGIRVMLMRGDLHDPDIGRMSITVGEVRCSPDLRYATADNFAGRVLYSGLDCAWLRAEAAEAKVCEPTRAGDGLGAVVRELSDRNEILENKLRVQTIRRQS